MDKLPRNVFPSEYQHEFTSKKYVKEEAFYPEGAGPLQREEPKNLDENAQEVVKKLILDRYQTIYQRYFQKRSVEDEEFDFGNELVTYIKNLYHDPSCKTYPPVPRTSTRLFGYAGAQTLRAPFSTYQDTYGRTGGKVILKNVQRMIAAKRRQIIQSKLRAASGI